MVQRNSPRGLLKTANWLKVKKVGVSYGGNQPLPPRCISYSTDTEQNSEYRVFEKHEYFIEFFHLTYAKFEEVLTSCMKLHSGVWYNSQCIEKHTMIECANDGLYQMSEVNKVNNCLITQNHNTLYHWHETFELQFCIDPSVISVSQWTLLKAEIDQENYTYEWIKLPKGGGTLVFPVKSFAFKSHPHCSFKHFFRSVNTKAL